MNEDTTTTQGPARSKDEIALELMKFVAITTGYGKGSAAAGFTGATPRNPDEHATALLDLYEKCRSVVHKQPNS